MIFIFGRYVRDKMLPPTSDRCPRCQNVAQIHWRRHYKTFHFFFFPMFSFGEHVTAGCGVCGYTVPARHPYPLPKLGFLDRMGFLVPFIVLGGGLLGSCILLGALAATAPPPPPPSAEQKERERLEEHLMVGKTWGEGPGADALAADVVVSLVKDEGFAKSDIGVVVQVTPQRRVFIDCEYSRLSDVRPKARENLVNDLKTAIDPKLKDGDHVVLAVKGTILYGILAQGEANKDWDLEIDSVVTSDHVETALKNAGGPEPATSASAAPSVSAPPAASASASAVPSASASAAPPKKKKKKAAKPAASAE